MWSQVNSNFLKQCYFNNGLEYHNWGHILAMYNFLEENNIPYNKELDVAIMGHDCVYDDKAGKEFRSAVETITECEISEIDVDVIRVSQLIMATERHLSDKSDLLMSAIVRADLHQLQYSKHKNQIEINFNNILVENIKLYPNVNKIDICKAGKEFIQKLIFRIRANIELDPEFKDFWIDVIEGLWYTIKLYNATLIDCYKELSNENHFKI